MPRTDRTETGEESLMSLGWRMPSGVHTRVRRVNPHHRAHREHDPELREALSTDCPDFSELESSFGANDSQSDGYTSVVSTK